jgi:hypothetical protein
MRPLQRRQRRNWSAEIPSSNPSMADTDEVIDEALDGFERVLTSVDGVA